jgi:hypothetical protein
MLRAALLGGGLLGAAPLLSLLTAAPVAARTPALATDAPLPESRSALFMGTLVTVSVARATMDQAAEATARAFALGRELEKIFTRFTADAPLGQVNAAGRLRDVPPRLTALLRVTADMHRLTDGAFDPTVLPLVTLLENSRENPAAFSAAAAREALALVGMERLRLDDGGLRLERQGMALTLDGIAKGHIADAMSRELSAAGCPDHCVNAGGDIVARGRNAAGRPGASAWKTRACAAGRCRFWSCRRAAAWPPPAYMRLFTMRPTPAAISLTPLRGRTRPRPALPWRPRTAARPMPWLRLFPSCRRARPWPWRTVCPGAPAAWCAATV